MDLLDKLRYVAGRLAAAPAGSLPLHTVIDDMVGPCEVTIEGRRTLMFGSNNYLGLSFHPEVIAAANDATVRFGSGTTGSRVANGTLNLHRDLERTFADLYRKPVGMVFTTGYQANLSVICGLCGPDDVLLVDADSHASIYDAARLSRAEAQVFRHNSPESLAQKLQRLPSDSTNRLVVVEGLYSIQGDVAPLRELLAVCREHGAYLLVDEAHSFGTYGPHGLGCCEDEGVLAETDFIVGTFSKALGGTGGFCVSNHPELRALHLLARSYVFTASGSPANVAAVAAALRIFKRDPTLRTSLWANIRRFHEGLVAMGCDVGPSPSPIIPIVIGETDVAIRFWQTLLESGVYMNIVVPPACRQDQCALRASCSAAHTPEQIDAALAILRTVRAQLMDVGLGLSAPDSRSRPDWHPMIEIAPVVTGSQRRAFLEYPYALYRGHPHWVPPLRLLERIRLSRRFNPFFGHADIALFLALDEEKKVVGRIAAVEDRLHNEVHAENIATFGCFEAANGAAASRLLESAETWGRQRGKDGLRGPLDLSLNESAGLLVDGFDDDPMILMPYHPPAYRQYLEDAGYEKIKDLYAWTIPFRARLGDREGALLERVRQRLGVTIRQLDVRRMNAELTSLLDVYSGAWRHNWGFVPPTEREARHTVTALRHLIDPRGVQIAEIQGRTVGFVVAVPDINQRLKGTNGRLLSYGLRLLPGRKRIDQYRLLLLGVLPEYRRSGLILLLMTALIEKGLEVSWRRVEFSWTLEDNRDVNEFAAAYGALRYKTYRIFQKALSATERAS